MAKTVSEFFGELSARLGIPTDHEGLRTLLTITAPIPDDVTAALGGLMTENEAKQNLKVKNHFTAQFADGIDNSIPAVLLELGIDQSVIDEIKAEKSTGKKVTTALKKLNEAKEAKANASTPEALARANDQIKAANDQVNLLKTQYEAQLAEKDSSITSYKTNNELGKLLSQHSWSDLYPVDVREPLINAALQTEMNKLGAKLQLDGDRLVLKQAADPALNFHYNNKEFTPAELVAKVMTDNKFIAVAPKATEPMQMNGFRPPSNDQGGNGAKHQKPSAFNSALEKSMQDAEAQ